MRRLAKEVSSKDQGLVSDLVQIARKRDQVAGLTDTSRKVIGMDGSEWFPMVRVSCLR